ncbi:hypothetical protein PIB30_086254 [Stylosanthes scabra]|uniref:Uncharacterized protein n=1 Tax=Stylosanthes scabra TaxID=79078 RepID=A0ABU6ZRP0_9FABA|nr:hypothetical protein [Stylosanthes scabra]
MEATKVKKTRKTKRLTRRRFVGGNVILHILAPLRKYGSKGKNMSSLPILPKTLERSDSSISSKANDSHVMKSLAAFACLRNSTTTVELAYSNNFLGTSRTNLAEILWCYFHVGFPYKFLSHRHNSTITQLASTANQCPCVIVDPLTTHPLPWHCGPTMRIHLSSFQRISYLLTREATSATSEPFTELAPPGQYAQTFRIV